MRLQVTAYSLTGERLAVIEEARGISFSNDGALSFSLPKDAVGIDYFNDDVALGVEIEALASTTFGPLTYTEYGEVSSRFIFRNSDRSRTKTAGVWTFTAPSIADAMFGQMPILPELSHVTQYDAGATPYSVIAARIAEAADRGVNYGITVVDGGGWSSPNVATGIKFDAYADLLSFYTALKDGKQAELVWVGTTLYVLAPGAMSIDRSDAVQFQVEDFSEIPVKEDRSNMADTVIALGDNGASALYPAGAPGRVVTVQFGGISDTVTLGEVAQIEWSNRQAPSREITASLALAKAPEKLPFRDYHVGSIVTFPTVAGGIEQVSIAQITLTRDTASDFSGNIVLDTKIKSRELRLVELGKQGVGGVPTISGNGATAAQPLPNSVSQALIPVGSTIDGYWAAAPTGFLLEDGAAVSRTTYAALFAVIGTTHGVGDGSTTFNLPDSRGRMLVMKSTATEFDVLGEIGGAKTHTHPLDDNGQAEVTIAAGGPTLIRRLASAAWTATHSVGTGGGSSSSAVSTGAALTGRTADGSTLPPYITVNRAIKY
jgi:microcystin-dependent protein